MCPTAKSISAFAVGFFTLAVLCQTPELVRAQSDAVAPHGPGREPRCRGEATGDQRSDCQS